MINFENFLSTLSIENYIFEDKCRQALKNGQLMDDISEGVSKSKELLYNQASDSILSEKCLTFHSKMIINIYFNCQSNLSLLPKELICSLVNLITVAPFPAYDAFKVKFIQPFLTHKSPVLSSLSTLTHSSSIALSQPPKEQEKCVIC